MNTSAAKLESGLNTMSEVPRQLNTERAVSPGPLSPARIIAYGVEKSGDQIKKLEICRRFPDPMDVGIRIQYCGICRTDVDMIDNSLKMSKYPLIPGHEITGQVIYVGSRATKFQIGERVGVGYLTDSCGSCVQCKSNRSQYCTGEKGQWTLGYNYLSSNDNFISGGLSTYITVNERFVYHVPMVLHLAEAAPLLCAGASVYSALRNNRVPPRSKVGVVGMGGLGHLAVKMAKSMGYAVWVIEIDSQKAKDASAFGAVGLILSTNQEELKKHRNSFDLVIDTASDKHEYSDMIELLKCDGKLVILGLIDETIDVKPLALIKHRRTITGSSICSPSDTQQMLDFCALHAIKPKIQLVKASDIQDALTKLRNGETRYRFVVDVDSMREK